MRILEKEKLSQVFRSLEINNRLDYNFSISLQQAQSRKQIVRRRWILAYLKMISGFFKDAHYIQEKLERKMEGREFTELLLVLIKQKNFSLDSLKCMKNF